MIEKVFLLTLTSDHYQTDEWLMKVFEDFYDPCPYKTVYEIPLDMQKWGGHNRIYVNPPYSNPYPWVRKAIQEKKDYPDCVIVMLLKHDSSTQWWSMLKENGARFLPIMGRLKFRTGKPAPFPSVLVIL
jgi:hypothetical protein